MAKRTASRGRPVQQIAEPQTIDFSADPILQQIQALAIQNNAAAEGAQLGAQKRALVSFGFDPGLDAAGLYGDESNARAAAGNPFSTEANLKRTHEQRQTALNQNLNKANLFYSSYRGQQLQNEGTQYLGEQAQAQGKLQDYLGGLQQNLLAAKQASQAQAIAAQESAYNRALANSLRYGGVGAPKALPWRQRFQAPRGVRQ